MRTRVAFTAVPALSFGVATAKADTIETLFLVDDAGWRVVDLANDPETS